MFQWGREDGSTSQTEPVSVGATRVSAQPQPELSLCRGLQGLAPKQRAQGKGHGGHCSKPRCVLPAHALHALVRGTRSREPVPWHCVAAGQCKTTRLNLGEPSEEKPKREEPWAELLSWWLRAAARRRAGPLEQQQRGRGDAELVPQAGPRGPGQRGPGTALGVLEMGPEQQNMAQPERVLGVERRQLCPSAGLAVGLSIPPGPPASHGVCCHTLRDSKGVTSVTSTEEDPVWSLCGSSGPGVPGSGRAGRADAARPPAP